MELLRQFLGSKSQYFTIQSELIPVLIELRMPGKYNFHALNAFELISFVDTLLTHCSRLVVKNFASKRFPIVNLNWLLRNNNNNVHMRLKITVNNVYCLHLIVGRRLRSTCYSNIINRLLSLCTCKRRASANERIHKETVALNSDWKEYPVAKNKNN